MELTPLGTSTAMMMTNH